MTALETISKQAEVYAKARTAFADQVCALNAAIEQLKRDHLPEVKRLLNRAAEAEARLFAEIEANPDCFVKPKTLTVSGIKFGYQKSKGGLEFDDAQAVVRRIKRHFPDQSDVLIQTKETPVKTALAQLTAVDLKRLGVNVVEAGEQVVIKPTDSEIDKTIEALFKAASIVEGQ